MQQDSTRPAFDQALRERVAQGRLDEVLAELSRSARTREDGVMLAYLFTQRGDYERAVGVLQSPAWGADVDASMLRARGNALWHAGRLREARHDLDAAATAASTAALGDAIRGDVRALNEEIETMRRVDRGLTRLDVATLVVVVALIAAVGEAHRRLFRAGRTPV